MTYNFDPDKWYDIEMAAIRARHGEGKISKTEMDKATQKLVRQYDEMWKRLDGSYRISGKKEIP